MSTEQQENLDAILRQSAFPADADVSELRRLLAGLTAAQPLPAGVSVTPAELGGVPAAEITVAGTEPRHVVLYFHGGVYVLGDAFQAAGLAAQIARRTAARAISVDYRLGPEHPYPAAADPLLSRDNLVARIGDYTAGHDPADALISPVFADLSGLPLLIIQAGTHEVLLDDALRLARQAALADVPVILDITPGVPHVFQAYYPILDEAATALDRAGQLLTAHLASTEHITA